MLLYFVSNRLYGIQNKKIDWLKMKFYYSRNHFFDQKEGDIMRHRRKKGTITKPDKPAHGERGVRPLHARDDSKILAHRGLGILDMLE